MSIRNMHFYGQSQGIFNTIIAGEGVNTTSAAQLETLLGLTSGDVTSFTLQGNDIYAYINVNYEIPYEAFYENNFVLSFIDLENKVTAINGRCFWKARFITEIKIEGCTTIYGDRNFLDANRLESLKTNINGDLPEAFLRNAYNLTEFTYDTLYDLNANALDNTGLSSITIYGTKLKNRCLVKNANLTTVIAPNVTEVRDQVFEDSNALTSLDLSLATSIGRFCFRRCSELVDLDIRSALTLGTVTGDNEVFKDVKNGINITANSSLQTSNGGGVEGDIAYAIANHSANVTYCGSACTRTESGSFSFTGQTNRAASVAFSDDGLIMWLVEESNSSLIYEYSLSNAWNVTTATYTGNTLAHGFTRASSINVMDGGTKLFVSGWNPDEIKVWDLLTANDITSAQFNTSFLHGVGDNRGSLFIAPNGLFYLIGDLGDTVKLYEGVTAWDLANFTETSNISITELSGLGIIGVTANPDASKVFISNTINDEVFEFSLSTPRDLSTRTLLGSFIPVATHNPFGVVFGNGGLNFYVTTNNDVVTQYDLTCPYKLIV